MSINRISPNYLNPTNLKIIIYIPYYTIYLRTTFTCLFILLFIGVHTSWSQKLDRQEKKAMSIVALNYDLALKLLEESVNINSGTLNLAGIKITGR